MLWAIHFVVLCYGNRRKLTQVSSSPIIILFLDDQGPIASWESLFS